MNIIFLLQKNTSLNNRKQKLTFKAGLSAKFVQEIANVDTIEVSNRLAKKGIPTDFKGNKVIAWCSEKAIEIFQQLNEQFNLKLTMPKGIYVEDFDNLNADTIYGFCNLAPTKLKKNSNEIIPSRTVFFNTFETTKKQCPSEIQWLYDWNNVNEIADFNYSTKLSSTDHFLDFFVISYLM